MSAKTYAAAFAVLVALGTTSAKALEIQNADDKPYTLKITENGATRDYVLAAGADEGSFCSFDCTIDVVGVGTIGPDVDSARNRYVIMDGVLANANDESSHHRDTGDHAGHGHHHGHH